MKRMALRNEHVTMQGDEHPALIVEREDNYGAVRVRGDKIDGEIILTSRDAIRLASYLLRAARADEGFQE
jgi:hypothetical protein